LQRARGACTKFGISNEPATSSNASSINSNGAVASQRATPSSPPTTSHSFSLRQFGCGCGSALASRGASSCKSSALIRVSDVGPPTDAKFSTGMRTDQANRLCATTASSRLGPVRLRVSRPQFARGKTLETAQHANAPAHDIAESGISCRSHQGSRVDKCFVEVGEFEEANGV
jgi:hypothetical protein